MPPFLLANAPVIAAVTAVAALFLLVALKLGVEMSTLTLLGTAAVTSLLAGLVFLLDRRAKAGEKQLRQARFASERGQAVLASSPGGYCLFTPQGILREA